MKKVIYIQQELYPHQIEELKEIAPTYEIVESIEEVDPDAVEIILGWSDEMISIVDSTESQLKWIQYPFAGVNNLPLKQFKENNIMLTNGSGLHANSVTETTMGLLLGLSRKIVQSVKNQLQQNWTREGFYLGLTDRTMLIVGAGKIGVQLARVAKAFDMKTIGINRSGRKIEHMDEQYTINQLPEVIHKGDVVVNILPLTDETNQLYDAEMFSKMKDGVIFINVGRGESVVPEALIESLDSGKVSRAGLDVFEVEPLDKEHPYWKHEKILMTPHIAGQVDEYPKFLYPIFKENLEAFLNEESLPINLVDLESGY